jgi:hypothetical protein
MHNGIVLYRTLVGDDESLCQAILLPKALRPRVMKALHDAPTYGHPGIKATLTIVRQHAYWKHMNKDIRDYVRHCETCILERAQVRAHGGLTVTDLYFVPWEKCGVDLVGPLPRCDGDCYIVHLVCWATGFNWIDTTPDKTANKIAAALQKCFLTFGQPKEAIVTDNGKEFVAKAFKVLTEKWGCRQIVTTPYNPKGNSRTERRHRDMNMILRTAVHRYGETWKIGAYIACWCLNVRPRTDSTFSPFQLLLGYQPKVPNDAKVAKLEGLKPCKGTLSDEELMKHLDLHKQLAMHHCKIAEQECNWNNKLRADQTRYEIKYHPGDYVILSSPKIGERAKGTATRLMYQLVGPFEVVRYLGSNAYQLRKLGTDRLSTHNVKYMNPYLSKKRHEEEVSTQAPPSNTGIPQTPAPAPEPANNDVFKPKPGDFMLYMGFASKQKPFHLVKVTQYVDETEEVEFQWYNNGDKGATIGHKPCWVRIETNDDEVQSMRHPGRHLYKPMCNSAPLDDFCRCAVKIHQSSPQSAIRLASGDVHRAVTEYEASKASKAAKV